MPITLNNALATQSVEYIYIYILSMVCLMLRLRVNNVVGNDHHTVNNVTSNLIVMVVELDS